MRTVTITIEIDQQTGKNKGAYAPSKVQNSKRRTRILVRPELFL
jgi:hypothetical protein